MMEFIGIAVLKPGEFSLIGQIIKLSNTASGSWFMSDWSEGSTTQPYTTA
jgi:hypothetical protein